MLRGPFTRRIAAWLPVAVFAACREPTGSSHPRAAFMQIVSGDGQQAVVGTELPTPLVVKVLDSAGAAVNSQVVNFRVVAGGGSVFAGTSVTNSSGLAQERWTLGTSTADSQRVEARAVDNVTGAPLTFAVFKAVALPGPPASVMKVAGDAQAAVVATVVTVPPAVRVADGYGNPVPAIAVTYAVASGGGSVAPPTRTTNDTGVAIVTSWTLGPVVGANSLTATVTGLPSVAFTANGIAGAPASIAINSGNNQSAVAGSVVPIPPSVVVKDAKGNLVPGVFVTFSVASGGGSVFGGTAVTDSTGIATVTRWTLGPTVGINTLTAAVTGIPMVTFTGTGVVGPAALIKPYAGMNDSATVGTTVAIPPAVQIADVNGNEVSGVSVIFTVINYCRYCRLIKGILTDSVQTTGSSGVAAVGSWRLDTIAGTNALSANVAGLGSVEFFAIGTPGSPASIAKQAGDSQVAVLGTSLGETVATPPAVRVRDIYSNGVPNVDVTFAVASGGGSVTGNLAASNDSGIAAIGTWMVGSTPGANTLTATVGGLPPATFTATGTRFASFGLGDNHSCAIGTANAAYCWGFNGSGELGDNTTSTVPQLTPTPVLGGVSFTGITAGDSHTCGLTTTGAAYCWGINDLGELGNGTTGNRSALPTPVAGGLTFASLSAGISHTCALTSAGVAYCWGVNDIGQLGDGTTTDRSSPTTVAGGLTFSSIMAGGDHTCGITSAGAAYCWGDNYYGQLGDSTTENRSSPTPVRGGTTFVALATGFDHSCGLSTTGVVLCWGKNYAGMLGDGTTTDRLTPTPMVPGLTFVAITAGEQHTCGLTNSGAAYCWGNNGEGELGNGSTGTGSYSPTPTAVVGGLTFTAIFAKAFHTCAIVALGSGYCWGINGGELGDGTVIDRSAPAVVR
jgi:alpha-tubulin suppressor-like RCC1 family protein